MQPAQRGGLVLGLADDGQVQHLLQRRHEVLADERAVLDQETVQRAGRRIDDGNGGHGRGQMGGAHYHDPGLRFDTGASRALHSDSARRLSSSGSSPRSISGTIAASGATATPSTAAGTSLRSSGAF